MQKIVGLVPAIIAKFLSEGKIKNSGILFMEEIGKNQKLFKEILKEIKKEKIILKRNAKSRTELRSGAGKSNGRNW